MVLHPASYIPAMLSIEQSGCNSYFLRHPAIFKYEDETLLFQLQRCEVIFIWTIQDLSVSYFKCTAYLAYK